MGVRSAGSDEGGEVVIGLLFVLSFLVPAPLLALAAWRALGPRERRALRREAWFIGVLVLLAVADRWVLGFPSKDLLFLQREFAADLAAGEPFVSTATGLGRPVLGHPLSPLLTPFSIVLALPWTDFAVQAFVTLHVAWTASWWWLLLRRRGDALRARDPWWPRVGAALATLSGFMIARFGGQQGVEYALAAAWAPSLAYALQELVRGRNRGALRPHVLLAALSAAAALALCPNLCAVLLPCAALFAAVCVTSLPPRRRRARLGGIATDLALVCVAIVVLALPELVPAFELLVANEGFTYRVDPASYRFVAYTGRDLAHAFLGIGAETFGRTQIVGWLALIGTGVLVFARRRVRAAPLLGAVVLLLAAADWAAHGVGHAIVTGAVPALAAFSIAPTIEAVLLWATLATVYAVAAPGRRRLSLVALLFVVAGTGLAPHVHRGRPGYDVRREAQLFAWADELGTALPEGAMIADRQPVTERAYLLPDPVARETGLRTLGEDWYALLPRRHYEWMPADRAAARGCAGLVTIDDAPVDANRWSPLGEHDAFDLAAAPEADGTLFALAIGLMREAQPTWDGTVRTYTSIQPPKVEPAGRPRAPFGWPWLGLVWPTVALGVALTLRRDRELRRGSAAQRASGSARRGATAA